MAVLLACFAMWSVQVKGATVTWDATSGNGTLEDGGGNWDLSLTNWTTDAGVNNLLFTSGDDAIIGSGGAGGLVSLGENITVGRLTFGVTSGGTYALSPTEAETLTINGGISANETPAITAVTTLCSAQSWDTATG